MDRKTVLCFDLVSECLEGRKGLIFGLHWETPHVIGVIACEAHSEPVTIDGGGF